MNNKIRKLLQPALILLIFSISACSNQEDEAKKLGFSSHAEMVMIQKEGFKTKAEYQTKIENEKIAKLKAVEMDIVHRLFDHAYMCYPPTALIAAIYRQMNETSEKAKIYYSMEKAYKEIIEVEVRKEGGDDLVSIIFKELDINYKPAHLKDEEVNTEYGKSVIAEHAKLEQDCANFLKSNQDVNAKFFEILERIQVKYQSEDNKEVTQVPSLSEAVTDTATSIVEIRDIVKNHFNNNPQITAAAIRKTDIESWGKCTNVYLSTVAMEVRGKEWDRTTAIIFASVGEAMGRVRNQFITSGYSASSLDNILKKYSLRQVDTPDMQFCNNLVNDILDAH